MFLFENVRGLLTHDGGKTYKTMLNIFEKAGYIIDKKVLNNGIMVYHKKEKDLLQLESGMI